MLTKEEILEYLRLKKPELEEEFQVTKLGLFGSFASDQQQEDSDIDILLEFKPQTENLTEIKTQIKQMVQSRFKRNVDLCREKYIKPYFKKQILKSAIYV